MSWRLVLLFIIVLPGILPSILHAQPYSLGIGNTFDEAMYNRLVPDSGLSFEKIKELNFSNQEQLLKWISVNEPQMTQNPVLVYDSRSIQSASFLKPRLILFGGKGLFLAFSEIEQNPQRVEIIQYDKEKFQFQFHEILYYPEKNKCGIY